MGADSFYVGCFAPTYSKEKVAKNKKQAYTKRLDGNPHKLLDRLAHRNAFHNRFKST